VLNRFLLDVGLLDQPLAWLTTSSLQLPSAIMIDVWKTAPFMGLLLLAGLQTIPKELYESARVDGATRVREFFAITLPLLRPAIGVALIFRTLDALRVFDLFQVLFGRSERSISTYNFEVLIANQEAGYASAVGVLIFLLIFVFAVAYVRVLGVNRS
jgi:trehalose/maltose transport system permease protein